MLLVYTHFWRHFDQDSQVYFAECFSWTGNDPHYLCLIIWQRNLCGLSTTGVNPISHNLFQICGPQGVVDSTLPPLILSEGFEASMVGVGYIKNQDPKFQPPRSKTLDLRAKWEREKNWSWKSQFPLKIMWKYKEIF